MELKRKVTTVLGLRGTGKSNWTQWALTHPQYGAHLMYDVCREHEALNRYMPTHRRGDKATAELEAVLGGFIVDNDRAKRPELICLEEASRFAPNKGKQSEALLELLDLARHYDIGMLSIARRAAQVHTDLIEMADNLIVFRLTGKNSHKRLEREVEGLGDTVRALDDYHYVHVKPDRSYEVMSPVPEMDTTGRL